MTDGPRRIPRIGWAITFIVATMLVGITWMQLKGVKPDGAEKMPVIAAIPEFSFTNQAGETVTLDDLKGRVWVADFIFTRCPGPCPVMSSRMAELQGAIQKAGGGVQLVSVTVDPEFDTSEVLAKYGERFGADPGIWWLLTGDRKEVDDFVMKGMLQPLARDGEGVPAHSQRFLVVDAQGRLRSYHDLDDGELIPKLLMDIGALMREPEKKPKAAEK